MEPVRDIMTPEQVAEYLQLDRETIYRYIRSGKLAASRFGRAYRVTRYSVNSLMWANRAANETNLREYTSDEIDQFLVEDQIDDESREILQQFSARFQ